MKSAWPTEELRQMAIHAVRTYGPKLLDVKLIDLQEYGVTAPSVEFFAELLGALCHFESDYDTNCTYTEKFPDKNGVRVVSRGLMQLSIESCNGRRYNCGLKDAKELHNRATNLRCAVIIMQVWICNDKRIAGRIGLSGDWLGMARYWGPFRKSEKVAAIRAKMKEVFQN